MEITYTEKNGILYPDLQVPEQTHHHIGKYGSMRLAFIKEHRKGFYATLLTQFRLNEYLHEIDLQAKEMVRAITERLAHERGIDETLKAQDGMRWVQEMNECKGAAEAIAPSPLVEKGQWLLKFTVDK